MLRNERLWFPRFRNLCKQTVEYKNYCHPDHMTMVRVVDCVSYRQVTPIIRECQRTGDIWLPRVLHRLHAQARRSVLLMHKKKTEVPYPSFLRHR